MNLVPLYDQILVRRDSGADKVGGIIIPDGAKDVPNTGIVIACGEGRLCPNLPALEYFPGNNDRMTWEYTQAHVEPLRVRVGQRVYFQSYAGTELKDTSTTPPTVLLLMSEDDVLAIVKDTQNDGPEPLSTTDQSDTGTKEAPSKEKQAEEDDGN